MNNEKAEEIKAESLDNMVVNIAQGRLSYLSELYLKLKRPIFVLALSILHDYYAAEDVMQETFLKVTANAKEYRKGTNARAWILSIARNQSLNTLKRDKKDEELDENMAGSNAGLEENVAGTIDFYKMIEPLDDLEKQILVLRFSGGLKATEIAGIMNCSPGYIRNKFSRALKKIRKNSLPDQ